MPYLAHFGLREHPFALTPNTQKYFPTAANAELLDSLSYAVKRNGGIMKVVGEVGTGKTLLCRMLLHRLEGKAEVAYLNAPPGDGDSLLGLVCGEFGLDVPAQRSARLQTLNTFLVGRHAEGMDCVLLVDEAQALGPQGLEAIRLLSNLETETRKLLQIVLFAQTELDHLLGQPGLRQLDQRIAFSFRTTPLATTEVADYIRHRLRISRSDGVDYEIFEPKTIDAIVRASAGTPRVVNILCDKALLIAYGEGHRTVTRHHARSAIKDSPTIASQGRHHIGGRAAWAAGVAGVLAGAAAAAVMLNVTPVGQTLRGVLLSSQVDAALARAEPPAPLPTPVAEAPPEPVAAAPAEATAPEPKEVETKKVETKTAALTPPPATPKVERTVAAPAAAPAPMPETVPVERVPAPASKPSAATETPAEKPVIAVTPVAKPSRPAPPPAEKAAPPDRRVASAVAASASLKKPTAPPAETKPAAPIVEKKPSAPVEKKTAAVAPAKKPVTAPPPAPAPARSQPRSQARSPARAQAPAPAASAPEPEAMGPASAKRTADGRWQWN